MQYSDMGIPITVINKTTKTKLNIGGKFWETTISFAVSMEK
jgi:hypothetical protein